MQGGLDRVTSHHYHRLSPFSFLNKPHLFHAKTTQVPDDRAGWRRFVDLQTPQNAHASIHTYVLRTYIRKRGLRFMQWLAASQMLVVMPCRDLARIHWTVAAPIDGGDLLNCPTVWFKAGHLVCKNQETYPTMWNRHPGISAVLESTLRHALSLIWECSMSNMVSVGPWREEKKECIVVVAQGYNQSWPSFFVRIPLYQDNENSTMSLLVKAPEPSC